MFKSELVIKPLKETRRFVLVEPLIYLSKEHGILVVPSRFDTDGASIPLGLRWLFPFGGAKMRAAVLHDYLYRVVFKSRKVCDEIFRDAMREDGVPSWKVYLMFTAVRIFGVFHYGKRM